jgi:hypothetical protein
MYSLYLNYIELQSSCNTINPPAGLEDDKSAQQAFDRLAFSTMRFVENDGRKAQFSGRPPSDREAEIVR